MVLVIGGGAGDNGGGYGHNGDGVGWLCGGGG